MRVQQFVDEGLGYSAHLVISERRGVAALIETLPSMRRAERQDVVPERVVA